MNTPDTKKYELGIEHSTGANSTRLLKDTTPDTEWMSAEKLGLAKAIRITTALDNEFFKGKFSSSGLEGIEEIIARELLEIISSRDTYWKQRNQVFVNNIIEDIENMKGVYSANDAIAKALDIIKKHTIR